MNDRFDNCASRFSRRQLAVVGAVCGDIIGSQYELPGKGTKDFNFDMFLPESRVTDDSVLTMAVLESLLDDVSLADSLRKWGCKYPDAGYGRRFREWMASDNPRPSNACTNGCAMRVSPIGAVGTSETEVLELSAKSAVVTHNHPDGVKGAQACALAVYMALHDFDKSEIRQRIEELTGYDLGRAYAEIQPTHQFDYTCPGSVPEAIICFLDSHDYESAVRNAVAMGGDADTMAAIAGSIAAAYYGEIPENILSFCLPRIPGEMTELIQRI